MYKLCLYFYIFKDCSREQILSKLDLAGAGEAELLYFLPEGVQLFTIEVSL